MAVLETKIYSALSGNSTVAGIVSSRIYPVIIPQNPTLPAVTYQRISSEPVNSLSGFAGLDNAKILINSWASNYDTVKGLSEDIHAAMNNATAFKAVLVNDMDGYDEDKKLYVVSQNFSCWNRTT